MPVNLSIENAPDDVVQRLRERAVRNHCSLQGELMAIIEDAVRTTKYRTIDEVVAEVRKPGLTHQSGIKTTFLLYQTAGGATTVG
jgi:plasmid stability protein